MSAVERYRYNQEIADYVRQYFPITQTLADAEYPDVMGGVARHSREAHAMEFTAMEFDLIIEDQKKAIIEEERKIKYAKTSTGKNNPERRMAILKMRRRMHNKAIKQRARLIELDGDDDD